MSAKLTDNQHALLKSASHREDRCIVSPPNLKGGAAQKVAAKLIAEGLAKEIKAKAGAPIWRRDRERSGLFAEAERGRRQGGRHQRRARAEAGACVADTGVAF
jgi:hypothetical protein